MFCHAFGASHGLCQGVNFVTDGLISVNKVFLHFNQIIQHKILAAGTQDMSL